MSDLCIAGVFSLIVFAVCVGLFIADTWISGVKKPNSGQRE